MGIVYIVTSVLYCNFTATKGAVQLTYFMAIAKVSQIEPEMAMQSEERKETKDFKLIL